MDEGIVKQGYDLPLTMSQENELIRGILDEQPNQFGSEFEDNGIGSSGLEETVDLAPFVSLFFTESQNEEAGRIKQEVPEAVSYPSPSAMATGRLPSREPFGGPLQFELDLGSLNTKSCLYSNKLNKLFTTVDTQCPMKFKWVGGDGEMLFLRAVPLFLGAQDLLCPIIRCMYHVSQGKNKEEEVYSRHVVRAFHKEVRYETDFESERQSVIVPLDRLQPGSDSVTVLFAFTCKNSCAGSMNRKLTEIVFTLENSLGAVLGRASVQFRICSCPKRDLEKEERERFKAAGEKRSSPEVSHSGKRPMKKIAKDNGAKQAKLDGRGLVYIPFLESMVPEIGKYGHGLLLAKCDIRGSAMTAEELILKKQYLELFSSQNKD